MEFIPQAKEIAEHARGEGGKKAAAGKKLLGMIDEALNSDDHKWFIGKMDPAEKARRQKAAQEFKDRYSR